MNNTDRLTIFVPKGKAVELKVNALKLGMTVSNYVSFMGTASIEDIAKLKLSSNTGGVPSPDEINKI